MGKIYNYIEDGKLPEPYTTLSHLCEDKELDAATIRTEVCRAKIGWIYKGKGFTISMKPLNKNAKMNRK